MSAKFDVAVVGATGAVGETMLEILEQRNFPVNNVYPLASERSAGKKISFRGKHLTVQDLDGFDFSKVQIGLFSAGASISAEFAPRAAAAGCVVIDTTSQFRYDDEIPLFVPEVNEEAIAEYRTRGIIANPNCSTIQLVLTLKPLHDLFKIKRVIVSTYQSITGTGVKAVQQLEDESRNIDGEKAYPHRIHKNALPHCDVFLENDYTKEEMKLTKETKKILGDDSVNVVATAVRIPVVGGHSESVNVEFEKPYTIEKVKEALSNFSGIILKDSPADNEYPMPLDAHEKDEVFVGRIRRDFTIENGLNLWIVADNLRKGAATNAVQIAEYIVNSK